MDNPRDDTSLAQFFPRGAFTIAAVRADPETKNLETAFATVHVNMRSKYRFVEDLEQTLEEAEAIIEVRDRTTDKTLRSFELRLLDLVGKNREDPRYRRYFPEGLRAVTEADARKVEPKLVRTLIKTLDEDQNKPGLSELHAAYRDRFQTCVDAVEAADTACAQIETQWAFENDVALVELRNQWVEERTKLHAELVKLFPNDPARVESFFKRFAKVRKKKAS
jgi:hypothetical protein